MTSQRTFCPPHVEVSNHMLPVCYPMMNIVLVTHIYDDLSSDHSQECALSRQTTATILIEHHRASVAKSVLAVLPVGLIDLIQPTGKALDSYPNI